MYRAYFQPVCLYNLTYAQATTGNRLSTSHEAFDVAELALDIESDEKVRQRYCSRTSNLGAMSVPIGREWLKLIFVVMCPGVRGRDLYNFSAVPWYLRHCKSDHVDPIRY